MRALALVAVLTGLAAAASAAPRHRASFRAGGVYIDGALRWRGQAVTSDLVWSERGDALAFAGADELGRPRLVVVLVEDAAPISWLVPPAARPARAVAWVGDGRLTAGPSALRPAMVAAYTLAR